FHTIPRNNFNIICRLVQQHRVAALRIFDAEVLPGLSKLFFSHFKLNQFTHLQSLDLECIDDVVLDQVLDLSQMTRLISLALPNRFTRFPSFVRTVELLLPQLSRLTTSYCQFTDPLPNLRCLKVNQCDESQLQHLFSSVPNLRSLSIELIKSSNAFWPDTMRQLIHLKRFQIKNYNLMTIDCIESIVTMIPSLKHLELELGILVDLKNEYRWDTFVSNLEKF
ncbi:unnamed protein product, partial [Adineta steineri]